MSDLVTELAQRANILPPEERARLAEELLASLEESSDPEADAAWDAELSKRIDEIERNAVSLIPAGEVFARAHCAIA